MTKWLWLKGASKDDPGDPEFDNGHRYGMTGPTEELLWGSAEEAGDCISQFFSNDHGLHQRVDSVLSELQEIKVSLNYPQS